jgi:hypothetical protein
MIGSQLRFTRNENDGVASIRARLLNNIVLQLSDRDNPARSFILNDAEHLEAPRRIAVSPHVHTVDDFSCAAVSYYD